MVENITEAGYNGNTHETPELFEYLEMIVCFMKKNYLYMNQYIPASRIINTDPAVTERIVSYLDENDISYLRGLVWTTDAIFRETADRIALRQEEGAKIVEMEQAGCIAVAQFRKFAYGALIYGGDDLSGEEWDGRKWRSREGIRYDLVHLCAELVAII